MTSTCGNRRTQAEPVGVHKETRKHTCADMQSNTDADVASPLEMPVGPEPGTSDVSRCMRGPGG